MKLLILSLILSLFTSCTTSAPANRTQGKAPHKPRLNETVGRTVTKAGGKMGVFAARQIIKHEGTALEVWGYTVGLVPMALGLPIYHAGGVISGDTLGNYPPVFEYQGGNTLFGK